MINNRNENINPQTNLKPDKEWLKRYKNSNLKSKVFYALLDISLKQNKLNNIGY